MPEPGTATQQPQPNKTTNPIMIYTCTSMPGPETKPKLAKQQNSKPTDVNIHTYLYIFRYTTRPQYLNPRVETRMEVHIWFGNAFTKSVPLGENKQPQKYFVTAPEMHISHIYIDLHMCKSQTRTTETTKSCIHTLQWYPQPTTKTNIANIYIYIYKQLSLLHKQHQKPKVIKKRMHVYAYTCMPKPETTTPRGNQNPIKYFNGKC